MFSAFLHKVHEHPMVHQYNRILNKQLFYVENSNTLLNRLERMTLFHLELASKTKYSLIKYLYNKQNYHHYIQLVRLKYIFDSQYNYYYFVSESMSQYLMVFECIVEPKFLFSTSINHIKANQILFVLFRTIYGSSEPRRHLFTSTSLIFRIERNRI